MDNPRESEYSYVVPSDIMCDETFLTLRVLDAGPWCSFLLCRLNTPARSFPAFFLVADREFFVCRLMNCTT